MPVVTDQLARIVRVPDRAERVISLVPSQTELLYDLGLGERVVGITKFCVHPQEWFRSKPRVGGTKHLDMDKVRALQPDLVIGNKEENERRDIEALEKEFPVWVSDVRDLERALDMISGVGDLTGTSQKAAKLTSNIAHAFGDLRKRDTPLSVIYLIWRDPFMAVGQDTFVSDMLKRCGLINALGPGRGRYPELTPHELADLAPDVLLLSSEPFPFKKAHIEEVSRILPGTPIQLVDGEYFSWYGSRLLRAPAYFNGLQIM